MAKSSEVAQLEVAGVKFDDWETVWVQHRWSDGWPLFRFTAAERAPLPTSWKDLQFKPGDPCTIVLGGVLAITGIILQRQTAYDAGSHSVQLSGAGRTWAACTSSVKSKDGNFDQKPLQLIADKVTAPFGVKVIPIGTVDATPFDRLSCQPGELCFDFLDRIARVRGATLGSDHLGNLLLIGKHSNPIVQQLTEGENILKMQCIFSIEQISSEYAVKAQRAVDDASSVRKSNEMQATAQGSLTTLFKFLETPAEQPVKTDAEVEARANYEAIQREGTLIIAYVTVQGWLRDGKNLWRCGEDVSVYSPMAMLNMTMKIQTATFTQDSKSGTTTTLELVLPWRLADKPYGTPTGPADTAPQPPLPATTSSNKPAEEPRPFIPPVNLN